MSSRNHIRFLFAFPARAIVPFAAFGQSSNGSISGNATDDSGPRPPA